MMSRQSSILENNKQKDSSSFKVYYRHKQSLIELKLTDNRMRVEEAIRKCIEILSDTYMIKLNQNPTFYALYPAIKGGQRMQDGLQISHGQRIKGVGVKRFYLQYLNISKQSIATQINLQIKYGFEKKPKKQLLGCFSGFKF